MVDFYDYLNVTRQVNFDLFIPKLHLTIIHDAQYVRRTTIPSKSSYNLALATSTSFRRFYKICHSNPILKISLALSPNPPQLLVSKFVIYHVSFDARAIRTVPEGSLHPTRTLPW